MLSRRFVLVIAVSLALVLGSAPALADKPQTEIEQIVGDVLVCDGGRLTVTGGHFVTKFHEHRLRNGRFRLIFTSRAVNVRLTDEQGNLYRATGHVNANFTTPNPQQEGGEIGHFHLHVNIVGEDGRTGSGRFLLHAYRDGRVRENQKGNCFFPDENGE